MNKLQVGRIELPPQVNKINQTPCGQCALPSYADKSYEATNPRELQKQIMDCRVPKNEREWWASRRIETLEKALDEILDYSVESTKMRIKYKIS